MKRRVHAGAGVIGLLAIGLCTLALTSGAGAQPSSYKPYSIVICGAGQTHCSNSAPATIGPAATGSVPDATVTFTNNVTSGNIPLGSDNLNVPSTLAGFSVANVLEADGTTALPACPMKLSQTGPTCWYSLDAQGNPSSPGTTVGFRNLNLGPGQSATFNLELVTPQPSTTACFETSTTLSPCPWTDQSKQSNDFSGTGNGLNPDSGSSYGTILGATSPCPKNNGCKTTLSDGGTPSGGPGTISVTVTTSSGKSLVTQVESLDYGKGLDPKFCSNISAAHQEFDTLSGGGSDRSQTISITTTLYPGYVQEVCNAALASFTDKVIAADGTVSLGKSTKVILPDGSTGYQGLLADCGTKGQPLGPNQVDCSKYPGVERNLSNPNNGDGTATVVFVEPAGFDGGHYN
jgi:hypothetical protein